MGTSTYLIALGSNQRVVGAGPRRIVAIAAGCIGRVWRSGIIDSKPLGPGKRTYANAIAIVESDLSPSKMLADLKALERGFGRRAGRRWGDRPLDLDIIAWSGGIWASPGLTIPHREFRTRRFVLAPLCEIAPDWRDPVTNLTARQLLARLDRKRPKA